MINWLIVKGYLCIHTSLLDTSLEELLSYLYEYKKLSWAEIAEITDGYACTTTLRNKAESMGIKSRGKGGPNFTKKKIQTMPEWEYNNFTNTELAKRFKVCRQTIIKMAKDKGWSLKKAGKPKVLFVQGVTSYSDQEPLKSPQDPLFS